MQYIQYIQNFFLYDSELWLTIVAQGNLVSQDNGSMKMWLGYLLQWMIFNESLQWFLKKLITGNKFYSTTLLYITLF